MTALKVGDRVLYRGRPATVIGIELTSADEPKYGVPVQEVPDWEYTKHRAVVDLDNGHWSYGTGIDPICPAADRYEDWLRRQVDERAQLHQEGPRADAPSSGLPVAPAQSPAAVADRAPGAGR